jgi:hypothetical protein
MDDWRLQGQERYLSGVTLYRRAYRRYSETWDHDHCAFCWVKFSEQDLTGALHSGYATADDAHWICDRCFQDFRDGFRWRVVRGE